MRVTARPESFSGFPFLLYDGPAVAGVDPAILDMAITCTQSSNDQGLYTFHLPCEGPYKVVWSWRPGNKPHAPFERMKSHTHRLQVKAGAQPQDFRIELREDQVPRKK